MPTFAVTDERTGRKFQLEGDSEPDEQELEEIFASQDEPAAPPADLLEPTYESPATGLFNAPNPGFNRVPESLLNPFQDVVTPEESIPKLLSGFGQDVIAAPLEIAGKGVVEALNFPTTAQNFIEEKLSSDPNRIPLEPLYKHGEGLLDLRPNFTPEELESMSPWQRRISGATEALAGAATQLTTPENLALLPAFGSAKVAKPLASYLLGLVGLQEPAAIERAIELAQDPEATPEAAAAAFTEAAVINPVFAGLLAKQARGTTGQKAAINALVQQLKTEPMGRPASRPPAIVEEVGPAAAPSAPASRPNPFFDRVSESEGLGRASTPPTVESIRAQRAAEAGSITPEASRFVEEFRKPDGKVANRSNDPNAVTTEKTGMALKSVGDLEALLKANNEARDFLREVKRKREAKETLTPEEMNKYVATAGRVQFPRETVEIATNTGSWAESNRSKTEKPLPNRPLDWQKNPEVAEWLKKNGEQFGIDVSEIKVPEPARAVTTEVPLEFSPLDPQSGRSISETQNFLDRANLWADEILNRDPRLQTRSGLDPAQEAQRVAAITIKGAVLIRDGVTNFKEWSTRMVEQYGEGIRSQLNDLWEKANNYAKSTQSVQSGSEIQNPQATAAIPSGQRGVRAGQPQAAQPTPQAQPALGNVPAIEGGAERMRQSAARATTSEQVPAPVQERIATAPESFYESQKYKSVEEAVASAPDAELAAVPKNSNFYVASRLELSRRLFAEGKHEQGYEVFKEVSKQGTEWGQNINQFKMLKGTTPANIVSLVNEGLKESGRDPLNKKQMEDLAKTADDSIQANRQLETAKSEWQRNPTDANAKKAQDLLDAANKADLETQRHMNRYKIKTWPQMLKTFAQGNPLTPSSHVANFFGNTLGAAMEGSSRSIGSLIDIIRSSITGGERKLSVSPRNFTEAAKGFGRGLKQAPDILRRGTGDVVKGESVRGLQPLRSFARAFAKNPDVPTVGGKVPINERVRLAVEGTFGIAPEIMLRLLSAADKPAYEAARSRLISEQAKLNKVPSKDLQMAQKFPELFFDKETLNLIKNESADAIFQRPSKSVNTIQNWIKETGDWGELAFTLMVSPYVRTPWNLVVRTLQYNPLIAAAKTALDASKGNTRAAEISAGRMVVGSILYGAGYFLYQNGLIGPSLEGRNESQKARLLSGEVLPPNHVNITGLERVSKGGDPAFQPGDETIDLTRGGGAAGAILSSVANIGRKMERKPESGGGELAASLVKDGVLEQANFTINQSFLKGVTGLLDAIQHSNIGPYVQGLESMLLNVGTPNTLTALSRATRENAPDMKTDTVAQEFGNVVRNRFGILGADDYLPTKRDLFGEPMPQTPEGRNAILYHLFDISKGRQVTDDPVKLELYRLWRRTASSEAIPSIPERQITIDKKTYPLPTPLYSRFAELVGKERKVILDEMVKNPNYLEVSDEEKLEWLEAAFREGATNGKDTFLEEHEDELKPLPSRAGFRP